MIETAASATKYYTWVVYDHDDQWFIRWHAVLLLMRRSLPFRPLGILLTALQMGRWCDGLYGAIASRRRHWSNATNILLPYRKVNVEAGPAAMITIGIWLVVVVVFNFWEPFRLLVSTAPRANVIVTGFALDQNWCSAADGCSSL